MKVIGITGGIGSGKSEVCHYLEDKYNALLILTDEVGHDVMMPGSECYRRVAEAFSEGCLNEDGTFNRKKLGEVVFKDRKKLELLDSIVHPEVWKEVDRRIKAAKEAGHMIVILETALPGEIFSSKCDEVWFVYADKEVRIERLIAGRDIDREKAESIMEKQLSEQGFRDQCDFCVDNSGTFYNTSIEIDKKLSERFQL